MGFVALLAHDLYISLEILDSLVEDLSLFASMGGVIVEFVHLIVVHFDITGQIGASAFENVDLLSKLDILHFSLA